MQIRKKWLNQLKNFINKHFKEYYLASFCWWIPSSCENHCNLEDMCVCVLMPRIHEGARNVGKFRRWCLASTVPLFYIFLLLHLLFVWLRGGWLNLRIAGPGPQCGLWDGLCWQAFWQGMLDGHTSTIVCKQVVGFWFQTSWKNLEKKRDSFSK